MQNWLLQDVDGGAIIDDYKKQTIIDNINNVIAKNIALTDRLNEINLQHNKIDENFTP